MEALLEEVADAVVAFVEALRVHAVEAMHPERQVVERRLDDEVEVVRHQTVRVHLPAKARGAPAEQRRPALAVCVVGHDRHPRDAPRRHVVDRVGRQSGSRNAGHNDNVGLRARLGGPCAVLVQTWHGDSPNDMSVRSGRARAMLWGQEVIS